MKYVIGILIILLSFSCNTPKAQEDVTYFGGQIVNPKSDHVLFIKEEKVIDTLYLDIENRFIQKYNSLAEGLYTFKHGPEFQYIYLTPKDSLLLRLNTWDFDESLVFSGKGAEKNELLINLFLQNEKDEKAFYNYYKLNSIQFQQKIDSIKKLRELQCTEFKNANPDINPAFEKFVKAAIVFPLYRKQEIYPLVHKRYLKLDRFPEIDPSFYSYRENINLNDSTLINYYTYQNYVNSYMYHLAYQKAMDDSNSDNITVNLLNAIKANIQLEGFKNRLLKRAVYDQFFKKESPTLNTEELNTFVTNCNDNEAIKQIQKLVADSQKIQKGTALENFEVKKLTGESLYINDIIKDRNTVIYFWSSAYVSPEYLTARIKHLKRNSPSLLFVGIHMNSAEAPSNSGTFLKKLSKANQFLLTSNSIAHNYITSEFPRSILVDKQGIVFNGFANISSKHISKSLKKLEKN